MPEVSIIIPCYNQGAYIAETIDSVRAQTFKDYEIIIVDDGSTDVSTITVLNDLKSQYSDIALSIYSIYNSGLSTARNFGISKAQGKYILPLDSDDCIASEYLEKAVSVLNSDQSVHVIYGEAELFGERTGRWELKESTLENMLRENCVYCSAVFRRELWEQIGGYRRNMAHGWEDWDFWLSCMEIGAVFYKMPEVVFYYRIKDVSMLTSLASNPLKKAIMQMQVILNHPKLFGDYSDIAQNVLTNVELRWRERIDLFQLIIVQNSSRVEISSKKLINQPIFWLLRFLLFIRRLGM